MKNDNWIYESVSPERFKFFFWQKAYIIAGQFRRYGKTTAEILKELLDVAGAPIDYTKRASSSREDCYRRETREIQERLHKAGIKTSEIFWSAADKRAYIDIQQRRYRE